MDIDALVSAIAREAAARAGDRSPGLPTPVSHARQLAATSALKRPSKITALRELMPYHQTTFLALAYRALLLRDPDPEGSRRFAEAMVEGRLTRWEVLGRLRLSAEGRAKHVRLQGLWTGFVLATAYRVPIVGPALALVARILRLPAHLQDLTDDDRLIAQILVAGT